MAILGISLSAKIQVILPPVYDELSYGSDRLISVKKGDKYGVIDINGSEILPFNYDYLSKFQEGLAIAIKIQNNLAKQGFIDENGKVVVLMEYEPHFSKGMSGDFLFRNGIAKVSKNKKFGFIDKNNKPVIPIIYDEAVRINDEFIKVLEYNQRRAGVFDISGKVVLPVEYDEHIVEKNGLFIARKSGESVAKFLNKNADVVLQGDYITGAFCDGLSRVGFNKFGYMDENAKLRVDKIYDMASDFKHGFAEVGKGEKWGIIDTNGKEILPIKFDYLMISESDLVLVQRYKRHLNGVVASRKFAFMDMSGKFLSEFEFDDADVFVGDLAVVAKSGKYGMVDRNFNTIIPLEYEALANFKNGFAWAKKSGKQGFISRDNQAVIPIIYDMAYHLGGDKFAIKQDGKWGIVRLVDR